MGIKKTTEVTCTVCGVGEVFNGSVDIDEMSNGWSTAIIKMKYHESSKFVICGGCRSRVYDAGFFKKIWESIFKV